MQGGDLQPAPLPSHRPPPRAPLGHGLLDDAMVVLGGSPTRPLPSSRSGGGMGDVTTAKADDAAAAPGVSRGRAAGPPRHTQLPPPWPVGERPNR